MGRSAERGAQNAIMRGALPNRCRKQKRRRPEKRLRSAKRAQTGGPNLGYFIVDIIHTMLLCTRLLRRTVCAFLGGTYALRSGVRFSVSGTTVFLVGFLGALPLCGAPGFSYVLLSPSFSLRLASQSGH